MKYFSFIKFKFLTSLQFRSELFLWAILDFVPFFILFFVFSSMYQEQSVVRGLEFSQVIEYYFLASIIGGLTTVHFEEWRSEEIRLGKIDFFLIRPFSYFQEIIFSDFSGKLFYLFLFVPLNFLFFFAIQSIFEIKLFEQFDVKTLPVILLSLLGAYCMQLLIGTCITLMTFFFEGAQGLQHFKWIVISVLSGAMVPVEFMPSWLQTVVLALPFRYLYSFPIALIQGRESLQLFDLIAITSSIGILFVITKLLLRAGVRTYASSGG